MSEYNGWKNWETWNVALWFNNDECMYDSMVQAARYGHDYTSLTEILESAQIFETGDGVKLHPKDSPMLDLDALDEMVREAHEGYHG